MPKLRSYKIDALARATSEISDLLQADCAFEIEIPATAREFATARNYLAAMSGATEARGALRATLDAWSLRHLITCLGLAEDSAYTFEQYENEYGIRLTFTPTPRRAD